MKRNKYLNTFDNTADYENYIESALPEFPNVGLTKDDGELHYMRTSPNDHLLYGEVVDPSKAVPTINLSGTTNTPTLDTLTNMFYLDSWSNAAPTKISFGNKSNIKSIKKLKCLDTSKVTNMNSMFYECSSLTSLDLSNWDTSNVTNMSDAFYYCSSLTSLDLSSFNTSNVTKMDEMFYGCSSLTSLDLNNCDFSNVNNMSNMFSSNTPPHDIYINVEATLMKLTDNLNGGVLKINATIHYDNGSEVIDYKWQNNKWTPQN